MASLSVVIPATDDPPTLERCLAALRASDDQAEEVIVVRDPSLSASAARNAGLRQASGEVVVFVDADVVVAPDALGRIRARFATPGLVAVFGSYDDAPAVRSTVSAFRNLLHHHVHQTGAGPAETFWTGLGAVRREALLAVGGFDEERYPHPSIEDIDLGTRLTAAGHPIELDPAIQGTHLKAWTLGSMLWTDLARRGIPWVHLQLRTGRLSGALNCGWRHRASAAATVAGVAAAVVARTPLSLLAAAALVALNHRFYGLLLRRLGPAPALAGVALHAAHHLVAVASVPVGLALWAVTARQPAPDRGLARVEGTPAA